MQSTSTPAFDQFFNFDNESKSENLPFGDNVTAPRRDADSSNIDFMFDDYPFPGLSQQPSPPSLNSTLPAGELNQVPPMDWLYSTLPSSMSDVAMPPSQLQTQMDPSTTTVKYGQITPQSLSPLGDAGGIDQRLSLPRQQKSMDSNRDETRSNDTNNKPSKKALAQRKKRTRRKKKDIDPNSPADAEKRSKFLERNRIAASKCRQKKREWAEDLNLRVRELQLNKDSLHGLVDSLKEEVLYLKGEMLKHSTCNCPQIKAYLRNQIGDISRRESVCPHCQNKYHDHDASNRRPSVAASSLETVTNVSPALTASTGMFSAPSPTMNIDAESDSDLEALLMGELAQDTSDNGIAQKLDLNNQ